MKKILMIGLVVSLLALTACGKDKDKTEPTATPVVVVSDQAGDLEVQEAINNAAGAPAFSTTEQPVTLQGSTGSEEAADKSEETVQAETAEPAAAPEAETAEPADTPEAETAEPADAPEAEAVPETPEGEASPEEETASSIDAERMDLYARTADYLVTLQFGDNHRTVTDGNTLQVAVWKENVALAAVEAQAGNEELRAAWFEMGSNMADLSRSLYDAMANFDLEGGHVVLYLLNDQNTENVLLTFVDGAKIFDVVQ